MRQKIVVSLLAAVSLFGCEGEKEREVIKLGAVLSTTGDLANIGQEQLDAANLAAAEINAAGGVLGADLEIVLKDDGTDKEKGKAAAAELRDLKVPLVVGAVGSAISLGVNEVLAPAGIVQISGSSTSPLLTSAADEGTLFRTCSSDANQGKLVAIRAKAKSFNRMGIIHIPGAYGVGLADAFEAAFKASGGTVTARKEYVEGEASYTAMVTEVMTSDPQAVLLVGYPVDGAQIIKDYLAGFSAKGIFWYFTDALEDTGFITAVGPSNFSFAHEGTGPATPEGTAFASYAAAFKAKYGKDPSSGSFSANAYDAVYLAALAMEAGGKADAATVKAKLSEVSKGGKAYEAAAFADAAKDASAGGDIDYRGASGAVDFDEKGDTVAPYDLWKVENGAIKITEAGVSP